MWRFFRQREKILPLILFSEWWLGVQVAAAPKGLPGFLTFSKIMQENWSHPLKIGNQQEPAWGEFKSGHCGEVQGD